MLLSILVGTGVELLTIFLLGLLFFSLAGKYTIGLFVVIQPFFSIFCGLVSSKLYLLFNGPDWSLLIFLSATVAPIFTFSAVAIVDELEPGLILKYYGEKINLSNLFLIIISFSILGTSIGAIHGFTSEKISIPIKINRVARYVPRRARKITEFLVFSARACCFGIVTSIVLITGFNGIFMEPG